MGIKSPILNLSEPTTKKGVWLGQGRMESPGRLDIVPMWFMNVMELERPMLSTNLLDMVNDPYPEDRQLAAPKEIVDLVERSRVT